MIVPILSFISKSCYVRFVLVFVFCYVSVAVVDSNDDCYRVQCDCVAECAGQEW